MAEETRPTDAFPGSPTGNRSGAGAGVRHDTGVSPPEKPTAPYPGSPTGNQSGVGERKDAEKA